MFVSTSWYSPFNGVVAGERRAYSWGLRPIATCKVRIREARRIHRRRDDVLIMTAGSEAIYLALFSLLSRRWLGVYDFLLPERRVLRILGASAASRPAASTDGRAGDRCDCSSVPPIDLLGDPAAALQRCPPGHVVGEQPRQGEHRDVRRPAESEGIVPDAKGARLKDVGTTARRQIDALIDRRVYLDMRVKVAKDRQRDTRQLRRLGFYD